MCELNKKAGVDFRLFQESEQQINVALKQGVDQYFLVDNFRHISRDQIFWTEKGCTISGANG
jgi:hypothetical protein